MPTHQVHVLDYVAHLQHQVAVADGALDIMQDLYAAKLAQIEALQHRIRVLESAPLADLVASDLLYESEDKTICERNPNKTSKAFWWRSVSRLWKLLPWTS